MEENQYYPISPEENVISQLWAKFFPYWPIFLLLVAVSLLGTWVYLQFTLPVYESTATILIRDEKKGVQESQITESLNPLASTKIIENEVEVIKARSLMQQVVDDLKLYAPMYQKGQWKDTPAYSTSPVRIEVQRPETLVETPQPVDFTYQPGKKTVQFKGHSYPLNKWVRTPWGNLRFSANSETYPAEAEFYFTLVNPKRVAAGLVGSLKVDPANKLSSVVNLQIRDADTKRGEDILNTLIGAYNQSGLVNKNKLAANTLDFLDERLEVVSKDLEDIERKMQQYRSRKGAIDLSSQAKMFLQNAGENDQKLSDVNMKLAILNQVGQYIQSREKSGGIVPSTVGIDDPLLNGMLSNLSDLESKYEKLKRTTGLKNPDMEALANQIQRIKPDILENVRSQQKSLELSKSNLYTTNKNYSEMLQALPQQERDLVEISREQNIKSTIYSFLLQKKEETAISYSSATSDIRVVDQAESTLDPVGLGILFYPIAAFLALGLGIVFISGREMLNRTVLFRHEIEAQTTFPIIGEIVEEKSKPFLVFEDRKTSLIAEEFRLLRTSLLYLGIGQRGKKILITSTIPGEGKSFVAANLAMSISVGGKKVILVEFDLSNPSLARELGIQKGPGVAECLAGEVDPEEVILQVDGHENLFFIQAGALPPNPSELILQARTAELLQYLGEHFDYVLVDSAPVGLLSDGYVLSNHCDATLYVVRHHHTPKKMLGRLEQINKINELKNMAIVFNGVRSRGFSKNDYGYGYSYGY